MTHPVRLVLMLLLQHLFVKVLVTEWRSRSDFVLRESQSVGRSSGRKALDGSVLCARSGLVLIGFRTLRELLLNACVPLELGRLGLLFGDGSIPSGSRVRSSVDIVVRRIGLGGRGGEPFGGDGDAHERASSSCELGKSVGSLTRLVPHRGEGAEGSLTKERADGSKRFQSSVNIHSLDSLMWVFGFEFGDEGMGCVGARRRIFGKERALANWLARFAPHCCSFHSRHSLPLGPEIRGFD